MATLTKTDLGLEVRASATDDLDYLALLAEMEALAWLLDDHLCNGWTLCEACDLGALSEAPVLSDAISLNDHGDYEATGTIYYFEPYQVIGVIETIQRHGVAVFQKVG